MIVRVYEDGKIQFRNSSEELVDVLSEISDTLKEFSVEVSKITTITMLGTQPPVNVAALALYESAFASLISKLDSFKKGV